MIKTLNIPLRSTAIYWDVTRAGGQQSLGFNSSLGICSHFIQVQLAHLHHKVRFIWLLSDIPSVHNDRFNHWIILIHLLKNTCKPASCASHKRFFCVKPPSMDWATSYMGNGGGCCIVWGGGVGWADAKGRYTSLVAGCSQWPWCKSGSA